MSAHAVPHGGIDATGVTGPGTSEARLHATSARGPGARWPIPTVTFSDRTQWIAWRPYTTYAATPAGIVPPSTTWGMPHVVLHVTPDAAAVIRPSRPRAHSRIVMVSASRMAAISVAIRRLAIRAAIARSSGVN